jgi:hypothetical protein
MSLLLGERSLPALVLIAPILAGLVWVLMRHLLHVPLPAGTFW